MKRKINISAISTTIYQCPWKTGTANLYSLFPCHLKLLSLYFCTSDCLASLGCVEVCFDYYVVGKVFILVEEVWKEMNFCYYAWNGLFGRREIGGLQLHWRFLCTSLIFRCWPFFSFGFMNKAGVLLTTFADFGGDSIGPLMLLVSFGRIYNRFLHWWSIYSLGRHKSKLKSPSKDDTTTQIIWRRWETIY